MSWLFSRVLAEEYLLDTCLDGEQSAQLSAQPTPLAYCSPDRMKAFSRLSRFGMTFAPLTESRGEELLMSYLEDFHARTYPAQGKAQESTAPGLGCGEKWHELSVRFDLATSSWKTVHCLFPGDLPWSSVTLPRSGMMRDGCVYQQVSAALITKGIDCGLLLATPTATANQTAPSMMKHKGCREFVREMLPTPTCHNAKEGAYPAEYTRNTPTLATHFGGKINPIFTEWMMGWPLGWTDLKPLVMDRFHEWRQQHSACLPDSPQRETEGEGR